MTADGLRARRVAEAIRAHLTRMLAEKIEDPRLAGVVVTRVSLSDDLGVAWVFVRTLAGDPEPRIRRGVVRGLERAAGRLKRGLGGAVRLKRLPELRFEYDSGQDAVKRVEELLSEIAEERRDAADDAGRRES